MIIAACRVGDAADARALASKLRGAAPTALVRGVCADRGVDL